MNLYVAGPMRGLPSLNFPAFMAAAKALREAGNFVFNPAEGSPYDSDIRSCMAIDTHWICAHADGIALLPGWEASKGARAELALAEALGIEVMYL
jgi:hypothetical protein